MVLTENEMKRKNFNEFEKNKKKPLVELCCIAIRSSREANRIAVQIGENTEKINELLKHFKTE